VLIVDDDPLFTASLRAVLEHDLDVVGEASDGLEAVEFARREAVDLIVMDVSMPRLGGVDATRLLVDRDPSLVVVVLTGSDTDHSTAALAAGARAYVRKSSDFGELAEVLINLGSLLAPDAPPGPYATEDESGWPGAPSMP
jgi:DNA-binding NarL/FixJ family response regulator